MAAVMDPVLTVVGLPFQADGSGYHRFYLPFQALRRNSRHVYGIPAPSVLGKLPTPAPADMEEIDVLVMQRPAFSLGMRQIDRLAGSVTLVVETDDDMMRVELSNHGSDRFAADPRNAESVEYCLRRAEMITVSTPYLAELYAPLNPNIRVLPNFVKAGLLDLRRKRRERVTVGWQGGVSHLIDLCRIQDPLREVLDAHPDVDMHWIGVDYSPLVRRPCRFTPWSDDVGNYYKQVDFDIAIAPLADVPFNRAKSYLKALDAAALGIPIVATDMEPYRDFVIDGVTGYLVRTAEEWVARLTELIHDTAAREEMGAKAHEHAQAFTMEGNWRLWEAAYEAAAGGR